MPDKKLMIGGGMVAFILVLIFVWYMMPVDNVKTYGLTATNSFGTDRPLGAQVALANGTYTLGMQGDGNLVVYSTTPALRAVAATMTSGTGHVATIDNIGVMRVVAPDGSVKWAGPPMNGPAGNWYFKVQPTGNHIMIGPDGSSRTYIVGHTL